MSRIDLSDAALRVMARKMMTNGCETEGHYLSRHRFQYECGDCISDALRTVCDAQRERDAKIAEFFSNNVTGVQKAHAKRITIAIRQPEGR